MNSSHDRRHVLRPPAPRSQRMMGRTCRWGHWALMMGHRRTCSSRRPRWPRGPLISWKTSLLGGGSGEDRVAGCPDRSRAEKGKCGRSGVDTTLCWFQQGARTLRHHESAGRQDIERRANRGATGRCQYRRPSISVSHPGAHRHRQGRHEGHASRSGRHTVRKAGPGGLEGHTAGRGRDLWRYSAQDRSAESISGSGSCMRDQSRHSGGALPSGGAFLWRIG